MFRIYFLIFMTTIFAHHLVVFASSSEESLGGIWIGENLEGSEWAELIDELRERIERIHLPYGYCASCEVFDTTLGHDQPLCSYAARYFANYIRRNVAIPQNFKIRVTYLLADCPHALISFIDQELGQ